MNCCCVPIKKVHLCSNQMNRVIFGRICLACMFIASYYQQIYRLPMNFNARPRKRLSFTPIMLTSKSIRPIERSDYELNRNERKLSYQKKSKEQLSHFVFRNSSEFASTYGFDFPQEQTGTQRVRAYDEISEDGHKNLIRKTTPTVVRVEFQNQLRRKKKNIIKQCQLYSEQVQDQSQYDKSRFVYFTNAKTFEQFTKMAKIKPHKRSIHILKDDVDEEWTKYLDKYYLNIRKVRPLLKRQDIIDDLSPIKIDVKQRVRNETRDITRIKGKTEMRTHSKRETRVNNSRMSTTQRDHSEECLEKAIQTSIYKKIQTDINNHKFFGHKKDFFVFGLAENASKAGEVTVKSKFDTYRDFVFRVNFTNGLYVKPREQNDKPFKFFAGFGNNSALIKGIMHRRFWWQLVDKVSDDTNFVWTQLKISDLFKKQPKYITKLKFKRYNHSSSCLSKRDMSTAVDKSNEANYYNRNLMYGQDLQIWEAYMEKNQKHQQKGFDQGLIRRIGGLLKVKGVKYIENNSSLKVHNHLQSNYFLGNKKALFYSLRKYYELLKQDPFTKIPMTFHITQGIQDPQFQKFLNQFQKQNQTKKKDKQFRNIWIIKPGQLTNRGRGITVCSTLDQIKNRLKSKQKNANGTARTFIVQKYIERPLLYQKRKFDIRHYMAITCHNGKMKGYWYAEGYIRTTSSEYNIKNTKDLFTHLTNDAVQKYGQDYGKFQKGNKISYTDFQKYLTNFVSPDIDFQNHIIPKMKELATDCIRATYSILDPDRRQHNFELFGLDYMLDQNLNVYIIEVNTNPCLETSCPLLTKTITPLIENVFKLCLDPLFPPPYEWPNQKKYYMGQNALEENKFSLVFDQAEEGPQLKELYKNIARIDEKMGDIFEEDEEYQDEQKEWNDEEESSKKAV